MVGDGACSSPILLVGTHRDVVSDPKDHKRISDELYRHFAGKHFADAIIADCPDKTLVGRNFDEVAKQGLLLDENPNWPGAFAVDIRDPRWHARVLGELVPKRLALLAPERIALVIGAPMLFFSRLAAPIGA